ncbi:MAG: patatin-like phospholipase family protein [Gammaproteobacteria bacterium]|nr:patatin-like phospholipase family protein [Gammaproteobacteria bacterium]
MSRSRHKLRQQVIDALFRDIPGELDRLTRESDFTSNRLYDQPHITDSLDSVSRNRRLFHPTVVLGILSLALLFFGPTFGSLCTALGRTVVLVGLASGLAFFLFWLFRKIPTLISWWANFPDDAEIDSRFWLRRFVVRSAMIVGTLMPLALLLFAIFAAWESSLLYEGGICADTAANRLPAMVQFAAFAMASLLLALASRWRDPLQQSPVHLVAAVFAGAALAQILIVYLLADGADREALHTPYFHVFTFGVLALMLIALGARFLAARLFRSTTAGENANALQHAFHNTELFQSRKDDIRSDTHIVDAFFRSLYGKPGLMLLPASLAAMIAAPAWVKHSFLAGLVAALLLNTWSRLNRRWNTIFNLVQRGFFVGWPTAISYLVIVIGLARFAGLSYVTTIVDSAPLGFFPVLVLLGYSSLWFFEYWINREIGKRFLAMLGATEEADCIDYPCSRKEGLTAVISSPRWLQMHGTGRLAVVGYYYRGREKRIAWHTYSYGDFLDRLRARITDLDDAEAPTREAANRVIDDLRRRTALYFNTINSTIAVIVLAVVFIGFQANNKLTRQPVAVGTLIAADDSRRYSLARTIADKCADNSDSCDDVVLVAASGGGSRAAMHTVAVLRALAADDEIDDVALVSGVSGGGASLGYFAAHHQSLLESYPSNAWNCFADAMASSFIQQVVESVGETRMARRTTLAHALSEALAEQYADAGCGPAEATNLLDVRRLGLILNTTVAGHPADSSPVGSRLFGDTDSPSTESAGARLAFTNLADVAKFPMFDRQASNANRAYEDASILPYRVVAADGISLAQAAALNANFPPVFPNSEVRLYETVAGMGPEERYFVTDGGVTENRGIMSLLLALDSTVSALSDLPLDVSRRYPDIRVVVADAGSLSYGYSPDRGIGTAVSGRPQFLLANTWLRSLLDDIVVRYENLTGANVDIVTMPMPAAMRMSGAIGTHWMLPATVYLRDPRTALDSRDDRRYVIDRQQAICLTLTTYTGDQAECLEDLDRYEADKIVQIVGME